MYILLFTKTNWLSVDPLHAFRSWVTPYNYVQNNPVNLVDPSGMIDTDPDPIAGTINLQPVDVKPQSWLSRQWSSIKSFFNNSDSYFRVDAKVTYGAQLGVDFKALGLKGAAYGNLASEEWLSVSFEQENDSDNEWDVDWNYLYKDGKKRISSGGSLGLGGGYEYQEEFDKIVFGEERGTTLNGSKSHQISAAVINTATIVNPTTGASSRDANISFGAKVAAIIGLEINVTLGRRNAK